MAFPLTGVRVLDMSRVLAGPFAGRMLADLGADVVKLEPPEGDITRLWGNRVAGTAGYFHQQNVGKRGICVDLGKPGAVDLVKRLAMRADILIENFRPDVMERLGVPWSVLHAANPRLIMLSITGFGQVGPERLRAAYAPIIHAESGLMARQAEFSNAPPADMAVSAADTNAALHGLVGLFAALWMREQSGVGQHVDIAMIDAMLVTDDHVHYYLEDALKLRPMRSDVWTTGFGPILIAGDFRHVWRLLIEHCGVVDPIPADTSLEGKIAARRSVASAFFASLATPAEANKAMDKMNLAWGEVRSTDRSFELPTIAARGSVAQIDYDGSPRPVIQSPYRFSGAESGARNPAPHRGQHNAEVLREWLGIGAADISTLQGNGVLLSEG